jgi:glycosyltransferase involved in cell wall biosynthesis
MSSGSSVRPQRMYEAFRALGYEVELLAGLQNRRLERLKNVYKTYRRLRKNGLPDLCYVEPPSGPFFNLCDHLLLIWLKRRGVPIGLFYRDAVWKFAKWWQVRGLKRLALVLMHRFDLLVIRRCCKTVFFPTQSMAELFDLPNKGVLPPAGEDRLTAPRGVTRQAVYVGGVSSRYGTDILLAAFSLLNRRLPQPVFLKLVCRESAANPLFGGYRDEPWLEIISASGPQLEPIYKGCDVALFSGRRDIYMDFCMPVKLFEYISYGLPVVTTDCTEAARFVRENGLGLVSRDDPQSFAGCIERLYSEPELLKAAAGRCALTLRQGNLWVHRARQAAQEILR